MSGRPSAAQLLECPGALLTRSDLAELGLTRTMIDAVFRACPVVVFPGSRRGRHPARGLPRPARPLHYRDDRVRPT